MSSSAPVPAATFMPVPAPASAPIPAPTSASIPATAGAPIPATAGAVEQPPNTTIASNPFGSYCVPNEARHRKAARMTLDGEIYERATIVFLRDHAGAGSVVHAGTFFGDFLPGVARGLRDGARLFAFEPNPRNFACARRTLALNDLHNVVLTHSGLGDTDTELPLIIARRDGVALGGASTFAFKPRYEGAKTVPVPIRRLDSVLPDDAAISIIQLDVERFEEPALAGALATIRRCRPLLVLENDPSPEWAAAHLLPLGYARDGWVGPNALWRPTAA